MNYFYLEQKVKKLYEKIEEEIKTKNPLDINYFRSCQNICNEKLEVIDELLKNEIYLVFQNFTQEVLLQFPIIAITYKIKEDRAEFYLNQFLKNIKTENQYYIKALILSAKLFSLRAKKPESKIEEKKELIKNSLIQLEKGIDIIDQKSENKENKEKNQLKQAEKEVNNRKEINKKKYKFMVYNMSRTLFEIMREFYVDKYLPIFTHVVKRINDLLQEIDDQEYDWKGQFQQILFICLKSEGNPEAEKVLNKLWEQSNIKNYSFHNEIFEQLILYKCKDEKTTKQLKENLRPKNQQNLKENILFQLKCMKSGIIKQNMIEKEVNEILRNLSENKETTQDGQISDPYQEIYAEIARVTVHFDLGFITEQIIESMKLIQKKKAKVKLILALVQAELSMNNIQEEDLERQKKLNQMQIKELDIKNKEEALNILQQALHNNFDQEPQLLYEACLLIWNISLHFLNEEFRKKVEPCFQIGANILEKIHCTDYELRIKFIYELASIYKKDRNLNESEKFAKMGMELSHYTEDKFMLYKLNDIIEEIKVLSIDNKQEYKEIQKINKELEEILKNQNYDQNILEKKFENLKEEEIKINKIQTKNLESFDVTKQIYKIYFKLLIISSQEKIQLSKKIGEYIITSLQNCEDQQLQILKIKTFYILSKCEIKSLQNEKKEIALENEEIKEKLDSTLKMNEIQINKEIQIKEKINERKSKVISNFREGIILSQDINQNWLLFNGALEFWNYYYSALKNKNNHKNLQRNIIDFLKELLEILIKALKKDENKKCLYYDFEKKIQVLGNILIIFCRILESNNILLEGKKFCEELLLFSIPEQMRKLINSFIANMNLKKQEEKQTQKKGKEVNFKNEILQDKNDEKLLHIIFQIEEIYSCQDPQQKEKNIENIYKDMEEWQKQSKIDSQIKIEFWSKIANLALIEKKTHLIKLALNCLKNVLCIDESNLIQKIEQKWFAIAQYLQAKAIFLLQNQQKMEENKREQLLFDSLKYLVTSCFKASQFGDANLVSDCFKLFYQIIKKILKECNSLENIDIIIKPIVTMFYYLKQSKQFFKENVLQNIINISLNLLNKIYDSNNLQENYPIIKDACDVLLDVIIDADLRCNVWFIKIRVLAKLSYKENKIMELIRECEAELQAKLLIQFAHIIQKPQDQYFALTKAIEILQKEKNDEIIEAYFDLCQWMNKNDFDQSEIEEKLFIIIDKLLQNTSDNQPINNYDNENTLYYFEKRNKKFKIKTQLNQNGEIIKFDYSYRELDQLIRSHAFFFKLSSLKKERILFIFDVIKFVQIMVFTLIKDLNDEKIKVPETIEDWFEFNLKGIEVENIKEKTNFNKYFNKIQLTLNLLVECLNEIYREEFYSACVILVKFLKMIEMFMFQKNKAFKDYLDFYEQILKKKLDQKMILDYKNLFDQKEIDKIKEDFFQKDINHKINAGSIYFNEKIEKIHGWTFWLDIAFMLFSYDIPQSILIAQNYLEIVQKTKNQIKIEETLIFLGKIYLTLGNLELAQNYLSILKVNEKNIFQWKLLLENIYDLSTQKKTHQYFLNLIDQFRSQIQYFYSIQDKKSNLRLIEFEQNLLLQSSITLQRQFNNFQKEIEDYNDYLPKFQIFFKQIFQNIHQYIKISKGYQSLEQIRLNKIFLEEFIQVIQNVQIIDENTLKHKILIVNLAIDYFRNIVSKKDQIILNHQFFKFDNQISIKQSCIQNKLNNREIILEEYEDIELLLCKIMNIFFQLWDFLKQLNIDYPKVEQKQFQSSIFDNSQNENPNVDLNEIKLYENQTIIEEISLNIKKLNDYLDNIEKIKFENKSQEEFTKDIKNEKIEDSKNYKYIYSKGIKLEDEIKIEKFISEFFQAQMDQKKKKKNFSQINSAIKDNIKKQSLKNQEKLIEQKQQEKQQEQILEEDENEHFLKKEDIQENKQNKLLSFKKDLLNFFPYYDFSFNQINQNYLLYKIRVESKTIIDLNKIIDYQSQRAQEQLYYYLQDNIKKGDKIYEILERIQREKDYNTFVNLKSQYKLLSPLFCTQPFNNNFNKLPKNSFYVILQFDKQYYQFIWASLYINQEGEIINIQTEYDSNMRIYQEFQNYYTQLKELKKEIYRAIKIDENKIKISSNIQYESIISMPLISKLLNEIKFPFLQQVNKKIQNNIKEIFEKQQDEMKKQNENSKKKDKKGIEETFQFEGLFFLLDINLIDFPIELFFKNEISNQFQYFVKDISFHNLIEKFNSKSEDCNEVLIKFISEHLVKNMNEFKFDIEQLKNFSTEYNKSENMLLSKEEWNNILCSKEFLVYISNIDIFKFYGEKSFLQNLTDYKLSILFCLDNIVLKNKEFRKYINKIKIIQERKRIKRFYLLFSLLNIKFAIVPKFLYIESESQKVIDMIQLIRNKNQENLLKSLKEVDQFADFSFIGLPNQLFPTLKSKSKQNLKINYYLFQIFVLIYIEQYQNFLPIIQFIFQVQYLIKVSQIQKD